MTTNTALLPTTILPKEVRLRGACGAGFGRGQLLARMHMTDRNCPIVVERVFMPSTLGSNFTTKPFAYQTRPFNPNPRNLKDWTYVIAEVAVNTVSVPVFQLEYLDGKPLSAGWANLNLDMFHLDERTAAGLSILTSLAYKGHKFENRFRGHIKNFPDADAIDFGTRRWQRRDEPQATPAPKAEPKIIIDADENSVMRFLAANMQGETAAVHAYDPVAEEAPAPVDRPRQNPNNQASRPRQARPFNGFAGQLAGLKVQR